MTFASKDDPYRDKKKYHMVHLLGSDGSVSALCFKKPRPINLKVSGWTNQKKDVTCLSCVRLLIKAGSD